MKSFVIIIAAAGVALAAMPQPSDAQSRYKRTKGTEHSGQTRRRFTRRDYDRLPIDITNPPNSGHYQYRNYPLWAARSFHPNDGSR